MTPKVTDFLANNDLATPCLVIDLNVIEHNFYRFRKLLPQAAFYYAIKANPAPSILETLSAVGAGFDAASLVEIQACLDTGTSPELISYSNTIKKQADIARAYELGIRLFAFDCAEELAKLAAAAPGSKVFCRLAVENSGAKWPLDGKFGCSPRMARNLLKAAAAIGLTPYGISFHVGSQQCRLAPWDFAIKRAAEIFHALSASGIELKMLNLGGGFPVAYRSEVPALEEISTTIGRSLAKHFGNNIPDIAIEPGRAIVAAAGVIRTEVILISRRDERAPERWVYLDIGRYGGLDETSGETIQYTLRPLTNGPDTGPVILAGPTCDSVDIMYQNAGYHLPMSLRAGHQIDILATGAYTTTMATVGFNGFPPLQQHYI
ncbi:MAG: type III PLP-dependent enzyme [Alphaproteobacteria bacterium]